MTESGWQRSTDPLALLRHLFPVRSEGSVEPQPRKSRLFLAACARRQWDRLPGPCRVLVGEAERLADGLIADPARRDALYAVAEGLTRQFDDPEAAAREAERALTALGLPTPGGPSVADPKAWRELALLAYFPFCRQTPPFAWLPPDLYSVELVREVFGNPFDRQPLPAYCRTADAVGLAGRVYDTGDFSLLPILADALRDAGCDRGDILDHFTGPAGHVRGCWALDLILGKR